MMPPLRKWPLLLAVAAFGLPLLIVAIPLFILGACLYTLWVSGLVRT